MALVPMDQPWPVESMARPGEVAGVLNWEMADPELWMVVTPELAAIQMFWRESMATAVQLVPQG